MAAPYLPQPGDVFHEDTGSFGPEEKPAITTHCPASDAASVHQSVFRIHLDATEFRETAAAVLRDLKEIEGRLKRIDALKKRVLE